jgi:hypothetical protein
MAFIPDTLIAVSMLTPVHMVFVLTVIVLVIVYQKR